MLGFPIGLLVANAGEWYIHKAWLHEFAIANRNSPFFSHITHHKRARLNQFNDEMYQDTMFKNQDMYHEKSGLVILAGVATVFIPVAPFFTAGVYYGLWNYWRVHKKSHLDPEYARKRIPWHYDHHMTSNQNANWCVTRPWFDYIMGTRVYTDVSVTETNPLGLELPKWLEKPLNRVAKKVLAKSYAKITKNSNQDIENNKLGIITALAS